MYWMCVQLWRHNYGRICRTFRGRELVTRLNLFSWIDATDWLAWEKSCCSRGLYHGPSWKHMIPKKMESAEFRWWSPSTAEFESPCFFHQHPLSLPQVQLLYELLLSWSSTWARLQRHGILRQTSSVPEPSAGAALSSPVRSSAGTALPDTSTCSPSADFGSPTEVCFDSAAAGVWEHIGQIYFERLCGRKTLGFTFSWSVNATKPFFPEKIRLAGVISF